MITLRFSPAWFYGIDIIFEILAVIITVLIGVYAYRSFRFSEDYRYKYLAFSFWAIALSFIAKIMTNFVIYYHTTVKQTLGEVVIKYQLTNYSDILFRVGYDAHRFLLFIGLLGIYWLVSKSKNHEHLKLIAFLLFIITIFSFQVYYVFHIVAAVMLFIITKHYHKLCFKNNKKRRSKYAQFNFIAFLLLFISQVVFIFVFVNLSLYVVAEFIQLMGFITFFVNHLMLVFIDGKKKDKD